MASSLSQASLQDSTLLRHDLAWDGARGCWTLPAYLPVQCDDDRYIATSGFHRRCFLKIEQATMDPNTHPRSLRAACMPRYSFLRGTDKRGLVTEL
jgi:hypothetical protein